MLRDTYRGILLGRHGDMPCGVAGKPSPAVVVGLGFGDEGKGMAVAHEAARARAEGLDPMVVRFNGGPQAGHNVRVRTGDGKVLHHTHSQVGSGGLLGARTVLAKGMLVDPPALIAELDALARLLDDPLAPTRVTIDLRCPVILPVHVRANRALEAARGDGRHGSTGRGIGMARTCEAAVAGGEAPDYMLVDMASLLRPSSLPWKLAFWRGRLARRFGIDLGPEGPQPQDEDDARMLCGCLSELTSAGVSLTGAAEAVVRDALVDGWTHVAFEGAQGMLLDERHGWFPHVTYGDMTAEGALAVAGGVPVDLRIMGVTRSYQTRHGAGPLPTEGTYGADEPDNCASEWAGSFRTGLLDVPTLSRAAGSVTTLPGGLSGVALSCLDRFPGRVVDGWEGEATQEGIRRAIPCGMHVGALDEEGLVGAVAKACAAPVTVIGRGPHIDEWEDMG